MLRLILAIELPATGTDETCNTNAAEISSGFAVRQLISNEIERQDSKLMILPR